MKPWIKIESAILSDPRILRLIEEVGLKGIGVYMLVRIMCESHNGCTYSELCRFGADFTSRRILRRVIDEYDLFHDDEKDPCLIRASVCGPASVCATVHAPARTAEPTEIENEEKDSNNACSDDAVNKIRSWLLSDGNLIWREPMMMRSGYSDLLLKHWPEAVEYFIKHALAQDQLSAMTTEHETRQYFTNFSRLSLPSGRDIHDYLQQLEPSSVIHHPSSINLQNGVQYFNGRPLPPDAPPRPSDTAEWDDASQSWFELYH